MSEKKIWLYFYSIFNFFEIIVVADIYISNEISQVLAYFDM